MNKNNFQRLLEEDVERLSSERKQHNERIMGSVTGSLGFFRMLGDVADLYMSRAIGVAIMAAGGGAPDPKRGPAAAPNNAATPPDRPGQNKDQGKTGPRGPEDPRHPLAP
jgi:hypothetical protein